MNIDEHLWEKLIDHRLEVIKLQARIFDLEEQLASEKWFTRGVIETNKRLRNELSKKVD